MCSVGTAAWNRLKLGTTGDDGGTDMWFERRGNPGRNWRGMSKSKSDAQLGLVRAKGAKPMNGWLDSAENGDVG